MKTYIFWTVLFALLIADGGELKRAEASTIIRESSIQENVTWTKEGSPYLLRTDHVDIKEGVTLTIEPGTIIKSEGAYIQVFGTLIAEGTAEEKIIFTSYTDDSVGGDSDGNGIQHHDPELSDARGIYFYNTSSGSSLKHLSLRYSQDGVHFNSVSGTLKDIDVQNSNTGLTLEKSDVTLENFHTKEVNAPLYVYDGSTVTLIDSKIEKGKQGESISVSDSTIFITNSEISDVQKGFVGISLAGSNGTLENVTLIGNAPSTGISSFHSTLSVSSSTIRAFETGLYFVGTSATITDSVITENVTGIEESNPGGPVLSFAEKLIEKVIWIFKVTPAFADTEENTSSITIRKSTITNNSSFGIRNLSSNSINAKDNFWGDATGPYHETQNPNGTGNQVSNGVEFVPWITLKSEELLSCCSNVIFIPGFQGSRLHKGDNQLWEPNRNADVEKLYLDDNGKSLDPDIEVGEIIATTIGRPFFDQKIYQSFVDDLNDLVSAQKINTWKALPYDWRLHLDDSVPDLLLEIEKMASSSQTGKVTIVTHSNGGLVAKSLLIALKEKGKESVVDNLVMIAAPQMGTPQTIASLLHGDNMKIFGGAILSESNARKWGENMPGAYNLLPSSHYLESVGVPLIEFDATLDNLNTWREIYGNFITIKSELDEFLFGAEGRPRPEGNDLAHPQILNTTLLDRANQTHNVFRNFSVGSSTTVHTIAGWGKSTPSGIKYFATKHCRISNVFCLTNTDFTLDHSLLTTLDGDGTVISESATAMENVAPLRYFVDLRKINEQRSKNFNHATIFEVPELLDLLGNLLTGSSTDSIAHIHDSKPTHVPFTNLNVSVHSPVDVHMYDLKGNHTGPITNPDPQSDLTIIEEDIPNSSYEEVGEGKYIAVQDKEEVAIKLQGTGVGTFTLKIEKTKGDAHTLIQFTDIPVTNLTKGEVIVTENGTSTLSLDMNGDNKVDCILNSGEEPSPQLYLILLKQTIVSLQLPALLEKNILKKIDKVTQSITKEKLKTAKHKLIKISDKLNNVHRKGNELTEMERIEIIKIINETLDAF